MANDDDRIQLAEEDQESVLSKLRGEVWVGLRQVWNSDLSSAAYSGTGILITLNLSDRRQ